MVLLSSCEKENPGGGEPKDLALAPTLAVSDSLRTWPAASSPRGLVLYLDRSGSMRGFLDPDYPARVRTDYRSVIDGLVVGLSPTAAYGFGNQVTPVEPSLGTLGDKSVYSDNNTELEEALELIRADSARASSHVLIGDGRRSDPNVANGQYVQMRRLAQEWIDAGGTFMAAASLAPFQPVPGDPAGCRAPGSPRHGEHETKEGEGEEEDDVEMRERCPLYAFAYVAPGDETRIAAVLAERFEHLFVWPVPAVAPANVVARAKTPSAAMTLEPGWTRARDETPILRVRGPQASNQPLRVNLSLRDTATPPGRAAAAALRSQGLRASLSYRPFREGSTAWEPMSAQGVVRPDPEDPLAVDFLTRGATGAKYLYRLELYPNGVPAWLEAFDAENANDAVRTYGLGRLFEPFRMLGERSPAPVARVYAVVN